MSSLDGLGGRALLCVILTQVTRPRELPPSCFSYCWDTEKETWWIMHCFKNFCLEHHHHSLSIGPNWIFSYTDLEAAEKFCLTMCSDRGLEYWWKHSWWPQRLQAPKVLAWVFYRWDSRTYQAEENGYGKDEGELGKCNFIIFKPVRKSKEKGVVTIYQEDFGAEKVYDSWRGGQMDASLQEEVRFKKGTDG